MTRQYLVGELSVILGELQAAAVNEAALREVACLRREAETTPPATLAPVVTQAVELIDRVCWDSLQQKEATAFICELGICAELWEFGVCAGFLEEAQASGARPRPA